MQTSDKVDDHLFQSTHPVRGATSEQNISKRLQGISIHAPREGCDRSSMTARLRSRHFNPRTP